MSGWTLEDLATKGFGPDGRRTVPVREIAPPLHAKEVGATNPTAAGGSPAQNKFGAVRTIAPASWGGERMADSKAGAKLCRQLEALKIAGAIVDWTEEPSIIIGADERGRHIRYRPDAIVLLGYVDAPDGEPAMVVRMIDAKKAGMDTRTSVAKRAALRSRGWNVEVREL